MPFVLACKASSAPRFEVASRSVSILLVKLCKCLSMRLSDAWDGESAAPWRVSWSSLSAAGTGSGRLISGLGLARSCSRAALGCGCADPILLESWSSSCRREGDGEVGASSAG